MPQLSVSCRPNPCSSVVPATPQRYDATLGARGAYRDPQECAIQACRASFSQSRGRACARAKNAFLPFAEAPQGCQKSRQISRAAPGLSLSGRHPQGAASPAGGGLGYPADTTTRHFPECIPCGLVNAAIGFVSFANAYFRNRKRACCASASNLSVRSASKTPHCKNGRAASPQSQITKLMSPNPPFAGPTLSIHPAVTNLCPDTPPENFLGACRIIEYVK